MIRQGCLKCAQGHFKAIKGSRTQEYLLLHTCCLLCPLFAGCRQREELGQWPIEKDAMLRGPSLRACVQELPL